MTSTPLSWWIEDWIARFLWENESNLHLLLFAEQKKKFLSWHHTLARGWPTVETTSAVVPMVRWKVAHPSIVSNTI
jgi:hypothetical protein